MNIRLWFCVLRKRLWLIVLLPLIGGVASGYYEYYTYVPVYESTVTLLAIYVPDEERPVDSYTDILAGQQLVKEYKVIVKSRAVTKAVINELSLANTRHEDIAEKVSVSLKDGTRILEVKVWDQNPKKAKILADKVSEVFAKKVFELVKMKSVEVIDTAEEAQMPVPNNIKKSMMIMAAAGLIAALGIIFILEEMDDSIKTISDVETELKLKVIGVIPSLKLK